MKRRSKGIDKEPDIMIIPMIDIVFFYWYFHDEHFIYEY